MKSFSDYIKHRVIKESNESMLDRLQSVLNILSGINNSNRTVLWSKFNNEAEDLKDQIKGRQLTPEESELYNKIEQQLYHINAILDDERYYDDDPL
jgi:hypothetical protein